MTPDMQAVMILVEKALADGKLTSVEFDAIEALIEADGEVTPEEEALLDTIARKVRDGEIELA